MTGPEHYRTAEQHLQWARQPHISPDLTRYNLDAAQAHATLALAAAAATQPAEQEAWLRDRSAWEAAVLPQDLQWVCDGCDAAMTTAPGGRVPDPPVCDTCWRAGTRDTRKTA